MKYTSYYRIPISVALWRSLVNAILRLISKYSFDASSSLAENNAISVHYGTLRPLVSHIAVKKYSYLTPIHRDLLVSARDWIDSDMNNTSA